MTLAPGTRLGPYEIAARIGAGGMGEVYRAHDARLQRDVAVKTSAERFSERFAREARAIAALNHPNICTLHDIGPDYLVMELVEGSWPQGPLPVQDVLDIAGQVAAALEAAHEKGIVHRDLKPANVKLTPAGVVKVLDFGLAKVVGDASPDGPTLTADLTEAGAILGTPAYMAPEQAQGRVVDKRADVWAFGVLVYELLTGRSPFRADSVQGTLSAVLTQEPDWSKVPSRVQRLLRACLQKDPRERLSSIGDWQLLLEDDAPKPVAARWSMLSFVAAAAGLGVGVGALALWPSAPVVRPPSAVRFAVAIPGGIGLQTMFALSPNGESLAIAASEDGKVRLRVRPLDALEARLLPDTDGAQYPFWKPDGTQIGFFADGKLKKVSPTGGTPEVIADVAPAVLGAAWNERGVIVFSQGRALYQVDERGGSPALLYRGAEIPFDPAFLPDGRRFLFRERNGVFVGALDGSPTVRVLPDSTAALYSGGHLLFRRQGRLIAQAFDAATLRLGEAEIPVANEALADADVGQSFSVAGDVLAYQAEPTDQLGWKDRAGTVREKVGPPRAWRNFRIAPDQSKVVFEASIKGVLDVVVSDLRRGTLERFTSHDGGSRVPVFSPDGAQVAFSSNRNGRFNPYVTGAPNRERLISDVGTTGGYPLDWSPDGKVLLYWGDEDLWIVPVGEEGKPYTFARTKFAESDGAFSPDGHWIAYVSNESGNREIYLQPFPEQNGRRYLVSSQGGTGPGWRRDGKELFYVAGDGRLTAVPVTIQGSTVQLGRAERLFPVTSGLFHRAYEASPDGQRFLVATPEAAGGAAVTVVLNWRRVLDR